EFNDWAKEFSTNYIQKKLELDTANLEFEKTKIELTREYRYLYVVFFKILRTLIKSYNSNTSSKIEIVKDIAVPYNLYSIEAKNFLMKIKFTEDAYWFILLNIQLPIDEKILLD